jgi:hypothetical protein
LVCRHRTLLGQPDDPPPKSANPTGSLTCNSADRESKVAAGPSTCGDWIDVLHHRTTGEPGQGVDGRLLCPVTNKPGPDPPSGGLFLIWLWLRQNVFGGANA